MNNYYVDKLIKQLNKQNIDAMFVVPSEILNFLIGHSPLLMERFQGMFITKSGEIFYVSPLICKEEMEQIFDNYGEVFIYRDKDGYLPIIKAIFDRYNLINKKVAVCQNTRASNWIDITKNYSIKLMNGKKLLEDLRIIKTSEERDNLREASKMIDDVFTEVLKHIKPGITEKDISSTIKQLIKEKNSVPSFEPIIASGPNSSMPHYMGCERVIEKQDIIVMDFGCKYKGLCSDITRTVFVGDITEKQKKIYEIVKRSNDTGIKNVILGKKISEIDEAARNVIVKEGYGEFFPNRLGHGIGYSVHEAPYITGSNELILKEGMAFSIEPGIYLPGEFGIRIEDIVMLSENGTEVLNNCSKDITIIPKT